MKIEYIPSEKSNSSPLKLVKSKKSGMVLLMVSDYTAIVIKDRDKEPYISCPVGMLVDASSNDSATGLGYTRSEFNNVFEEVHGTITITI